jgi:hypothetical protein
MDVGRVGIWTGQLDLQPAARAREVAAEIDALGYGALWIPEAVGREAFSHAAVLLDATDRLVVATGVANIYNRTPVAAANAQRLLADDSGPACWAWGATPRRSRACSARAEWLLLLGGLSTASTRLTVSPRPTPAPGLAAPALHARAPSPAWGALTYFVLVDHAGGLQRRPGAGRWSSRLPATTTPRRPGAPASTCDYLTLPNYVGNQAPRLG